MAKLTHKLIAETAKEMAGAVYEELARNDFFYKQWPKQTAFIARNWQHFVKPARESLAHLLSLPGTPDDEKDVIYDALLHERTLPTGNVSSAPRLTR